MIWIVNSDFLGRFLRTECSGRIRNHKQKTLRVPQPALSTLNIHMCSGFSQWMIIAAHLRTGSAHNRGQPPLSKVPWGDPPTLSSHPLPAELKSLGQSGPHLHPSIYPSIFFRCIGGLSRVFQTSFSTTMLSTSSWGTTSCSQAKCDVGLPADGYKTPLSWGEPPQLGPFDTKEQRLLLQLHTDVWAPHLVSKAKLSTQ